MIEVSYRYKVTCDTCGATDESTESAIPPVADAVPIEWLAVVPIGETAQRHFCSKECEDGYDPPPKPWEE